jgi:hypothetical protein
MYIIGDKNTNKFPFAVSVNAEKYLSDTSEFSNKYKHLSSNDEGIERFCFERWFLLRALMKEHKLNKIFTCDSDVMLYANVTDEDKSLGNYLAAYTIPNYQDNYRLSASAHVSFWTYDGIDLFCSFLNRTYTEGSLPAEIEEKWKIIQSGTAPGGISDMLFLYLFSREKNVLNLSLVRKQSTFDDNINASENHFKDEYEMSGNLKKIVWKNGLPYCMNFIEKKEILFKALHCQGVAKALAEKFYKINHGAIRAAWVKWMFKLGKIRRKFY